MMKTTKMAETFTLGLVITLVIAVITYVLLQIGSIIKGLLTPIAHMLDPDKSFDEFSITLIAFMALVIVIFVLGFIAQLPLLSKFKIKLENLLLKLYPPINYVKAWVEERLKPNNPGQDWKAVLALMDDQYWPAFIVEENDEWMTLSVLYAPHSDPLETMIVRKDDVPCIPMTTSQMLQNNRLYGKGHLALIPASLKK